MRGLLLSAPSTPIDVQITAKGIAEEVHNCHFELSAEEYAKALPFCNDWPGWIKWAIDKFDCYAVAESRIGSINQQIVKTALLHGSPVTFGRSEVTGVQKINEKNQSRGWRIVFGPVEATIVLRKLAEPIEIDRNDEIEGVLSTDEFEEL